MDGMHVLFFKKYYMYLFIFKYIMDWERIQIHTNRMYYQLGYSYIIYCYYSKNSNNSNFIKYFLY